MGAENERAFHLERAAQCRKMAEESSETSVRHLHEQLAAFHEAEAKKGPAAQTAANEDVQ